MSTTQVTPHYPTQEDINAYNGYFNAPNHLKVRNEPSSEELYVAAFLRDSGLKFETEVPLYNLQGDTKKYRRADFKLTDLGVYVEYFGQYNSTKLKRAEYDKKVEVYLRNNIPTIFIYPHELGFLEYAFHFKMVKLLKLEKFNFKKSLFKYRLSRFKDNFFHTTDFGGAAYFALFIASTIILVDIETGLSDKLATGLLLASFTGMFLNIKNFILDVRRYFYKDE